MEILGEIPAIYLNPFLVAESQQEAMLGYIVIGYQPAQASRSYDLLFLRGSQIYECITLDDIRRERTDISAARARFKSSVQQDGTFIYLFRAEALLMQQFISTVYIQPAFKVNVDALSKRQTVKLLRTAACRRALVERNDFTQKLPSIEFREIDPRSDALEFQLGFKHGGFLLYDYSAPARVPGVHPAETPVLQTEFAFVISPQHAPAGSRKKAAGTKKPMEVDNTTSQHSEDEPELVTLFSRLLRSFRQQAFEYLGTKSESAIVEAERRVQLLNPEFALDSLNATTAPLVLDLIESVIQEASLLKRAKLRAAALALIADLYNKQYELLERHKAIDKVEQVYYRMKR